MRHHIRLTAKNQMNTILLNRIKQNVIGSAKIQIYTKVIGYM